MTASKAGRQRSRTVKAAAATVRARRDRDTELKDARYMYLSIDEASTHVSKRFFRLLTGSRDAFSVPVHKLQLYQLLGCFQYETHT